MKHREEHGVTSVNFSNMTKQRKFTVWEFIPALAGSFDYAHALCWVQRHLGKGKQLSSTSVSTLCA